MQVVKILVSALLVTLSISAVADREKEQEYFDKVFSEIKEKCKGSSNYMQCRAEYSPKKCRGLAFGADVSGWARCVRSCGNAGFFSRSVGECS